MKRCGAGLALMLALVACETRAEITINNDGSGTFGFAFGMAGSYATPALEDIGKLMQEELSDGPIEWSFERVDEPMLKGFRATTHFTDMEDLRNKMKVLSESGAGDFAGRQDNLGQDFVIQRVGGGWTLRAHGATTGLDDENPWLDEGTKRLMNQMFRFEFRITLPGYEADSNADEVKRSGSRTMFIWRSSQFTSEAVELRANTTDEAPAGLPIIPMGAGVLAVAGAVLFFKRRPRTMAGGPPPVVLEGFAEARVPTTIGAPSEPGQPAE